MEVQGHAVWLNQCSSGVSTSHGRRVSWIDLGSMPCFSGRRDCFSDTFERHIERLSLVFERLRKANLKLKPEKCCLFQKRIHFLGHVVSAAGVEPDQRKVQAVVDWPTPRTLTEVRAFVALASYYRRHIAGFAEIARPLHELTRKGRSFVWTERQQRAFVKLKNSLVNAPVLAAPIDGGKYTCLLYTSPSPRD